MSNFNEIVKGIKSLEIQGATDVAKKSLEAIKDKSDNLSAKGSTEFFKKLKKAEGTLLQTRPTEPYMQNSLNYVLHQVKESYDEETSVEDMKKYVSSAVKEFKSQMKDNQERISKIGAQKIKDNSTILTHCHSSNVINVLKEAKKQGKDFKVIFTETRPLYQGRRTAKDLSDAGIEAEMITDSAISPIVGDTDMTLIGADVITNEMDTINKIGSFLIALATNRVYNDFHVVTPSLKFDYNSIYTEGKEVEERKPEEIWENPPKGINIRNIAFDVVKRDFITSYITELGVIPPEALFREILNNYGYIFEEPKL